MEVIGTIAAAVQLAGLCVSVRKYILRVRTDARLIPELYENSKIILAEIDRLSPELSPEHKQATETLTFRLREIQSTIDKMNQRKPFATLFAGIRGHSCAELKTRMADALHDYQTLALMHMLHAQMDVSKKLENILVLPHCGLSRHLTGNTPTNLTLQQGGLNELWGSGFETIRNLLIESLRTELDPLRCRLDALGVFGTRRIADDLKLYYGTMMTYLDSIQNSGDYTSDQDVWECFHSVLAVSKDLNLSEIFRGLTLDVDFEGKLRGRYGIFRY